MSRVHIKMEGRSAFSNSSLRLHISAHYMGENIVCEMVLCMLILSFAVRSLSDLANLDLARSLTILLARPA
jgi:hypothetical protein